jgi:UDP-glucose 4-epimerase
MQINRVLITGVAGFIGSNLLDYLLENTNWEIVGVDNFSTGNANNISNKLEHPKFRFIETNVSMIDSLLEYDCVFHLAALPRIQPSFEFVTQHITENLTNSVHLLELMIKENYFPRFIFSSSSAIYGTPSTIPTPESEQISCISPYAFQKYEVEKYLDLLATRYPLDYVNLRYFNPYGPRSYNPENNFNAYSSVVGIFLHRKQINEALLVTGDGSQRRDFIHVYDLAKANYLAAVQNKKLNCAFNIGNGSTMSVLELAQMISKNIKFIEQREGESEITWADTKRAQEVLGWSPEYKLEEFIKSQL